jgi:hypothetical protein
MDGSKRGTVDTCMVQSIAQGADNNPLFKRFSNAWLDNITKMARRMPPGPNPPLPSFALQGCPHPASLRSRRTESPACGSLKAQCHCRKFQCISCILMPPDGFNYARRGQNSLLAPILGVP